MQKIALSFAACLLAVAATGAGAGTTIWKWRDASGQIHLSDTPPPSSVPAKDILSRPNGGGGAVVTSGAPPAPAAAPSGPASAVATGDSELQKKKLKADQERAEKATAEKTAVDQKNAAARADNCARAQAQAKTLQSGVRIARLDAKGEREYLDDNARAAEGRRAQDAIAQNCGSAPAPTAP